MKKTFFKKKIFFWKNFEKFFLKKVAPLDGLKLQKKFFFKKIKKKLPKKNVGLFFRPFFQIGSTTRFIILLPQIMGQKNPLPIGFRIKKKFEKIFIEG